MLLKVPKLRVEGSIPSTRSNFFPAPGLFQRNGRVRAGRPCSVFSHLNGATANCQTAR